MIPITSSKRPETELAAARTIPEGARREELEAVACPIPFSEVEDAGDSVCSIPYPELGDAGDSVCSVVYPELGDIEGGRLESWRSGSLQNAL